MTTVRASIAVALLLGFFVFAFGIIAAMFAVAVAVGHRAGLQIGGLAVVVTAGIARAVWQVLRGQSDPPTGLLLRPDQAPELFAHVGQLARTVGTRPPDEIRLVPDINAAVSESTGLLGLRPGVRRMYVGMPLLAVLTVDQVRAVLAHELGHYSHSHTRLGEITYRGRATILRTAANLGGHAVVRQLFLGYLRLYMLVSQAVSRQQELEADRAAVRVAGRAATASALEEIDVLAAAWGFYLANYVEWGYQLGLFPDRVFGGFSDMLAARGRELASLRAAGPTGTTSRWDSHPSTAERVAAITREPDAPRTPDHRFASRLLLDFPGLLGAVESGAFDVGQRTVLPWDQFTARAADLTFQRDADTLYRAAARVADVQSASLPVVFDLLAAGRAMELACALSRVDPNDPRQRQEALRQLVRLVETAIGIAATRGGAAYWRHSWSEPVSLAAPDGSPLNLRAVVEQAVADPDRVPPLRAALARMGADESQAVQVRARATAETADAIGAIADVRLDSAVHDLLVLDEGLIFVERPRRPAMQGEARLRFLLGSAPVDQLAKYNRWLPYEDIAGVEVVRKLPVTYRIRLHAGAGHTLRIPITCDAIGRSAETLGRVLGRYA